MGEICGKMIRPVRSTERQWTNDGRQTSTSIETRTNDDDVDAVLRPEAPKFEVKAESGEGLVRRGH